MCGHFGQMDSADGRTSSAAPRGSMRTGREVRGDGLPFPTRRRQPPELGPRPGAADVILRQPPAPIQKACRSSPLCLPTCSPQPNPPTYLHSHKTNSTPSTNPPPKPPQCSAPPSSATPASSPPRPRPGRASPTPSRALPSPSTGPSRTSSSRESRRAVCHPSLVLFQPLHAWLDLRDGGFGSKRTAAGGA